MKSDVGEITPLRHLQLIETRILENFIDFCDENDIRYFAVGGTLLGAVRHKGFIPWDDDIDIGLPRVDYERFLKLCQEKPVPFELHTFTNDKGYYRYFSRILDPTVKVRRTENTIEEISPAWIDIFPLDGMPNNSVLRMIKKYYILWRRAAYRFSVFDLNVNTKKEGRPFIERILVKMGQILPVQKIFKLENEYRKLDKTLKRNSYDQSKYIILAMGAYKYREMFEKTVFGEGSLYEFEGMQLKGPTDYVKYLTQLYGPDYMTPPSDAERNHHFVAEILE